MKKALTALVALALMFVGVSAQAASITYQNFSDDFTSIRAVATSTGTAIPSGGGFAAIGYFGALSDAQITAAPSGSSYAALAADFQQFGASTTFGGGFGVAGLYKAAPSANINAGSAFIGKNIYTVVGNGATLAASTELLVYKSTATFGQDNPLFTATVSTASPAPTASESLLIGKFGLVSIDSGTGAQPAFQTVAAAVIPEPSIIALMGFGLVGFARRRRA